jgi:ATP-dependent DNA helicase DinG
LIEARRNDAQEMGFDPLLAVDYPEMALRLKQGCGRLIRGKDDRGIIAILEPIKGFPWEQVVLGSLPSEAKIVNNLAKAGLTDYKNVT